MQEYKEMGDFMKRSVFELGKHFWRAFRSSGLISKLFLFALLIIPLLFSVSCTSGGKSGGQSISETSKYHILVAKSADLTPVSGDEYTLTLNGVDIYEYWFTQEGETIINSGVTFANQFVARGWSVQYNKTTPPAMIITTDSNGNVIGYYLSLANPEHNGKTAQFTFPARWIGSSIDTGFNPGSEVKIGELYLLVARDDVEQSLDENGNPKKPDREKTPASTPSPAAPGAAVSPGQEGMDPQVAFAMTNVQLAQALGQVLTNRTQDMQNTLNTINGYEGSKNRIRNMKEALANNQMPSQDDIAFLKSNGLLSDPLPADRHAWMDVLNAAMDKINGLQQQATARSTNDQMTIQHMMQTYNVAIQAATNLLAAYAQTTQSIVRNLR